MRLLLPELSNGHKPAGQTQPGCRAPGAGRAGEVVVPLWGGTALQRGRVGAFETQVNIPSSILGCAKRYPHSGARLLQGVLLQMLGTGTLRGKKAACPVLAWMRGLMRACAHVFGEARGVGEIFPCPSRPFPSEPLQPPWGFPGTGKLIQVFSSVPCSTSLKPRTSRRRK